jgi:hypothetical protein
MLICCGYSLIIHRYRVDVSTKDPFPLAGELRLTEELSRGLLLFKPTVVFDKRRSFINV